MLIRCMHVFGRNGIRWYEHAKRWANTCTHVEHRRIALAKCNMRILAQMNEFLPTYTLSAATALFHPAPSGIAYHMLGVRLRRSELFEVAHSQRSTSDNRTLLLCFGSMSNGDSSCSLLGTFKRLLSFALNKHSLVPSADRVLLQSFTAVPPRLNSSAADKTDTPVVMR